MDDTHGAEQRQGQAGKGRTNGATPPPGSSTGNAELDELLVRAQALDEGDIEGLREVLIAANAAQLSPAEKRRLHKALKDSTGFGLGVIREEEELLVGAARKPDKAAATQSFGMEEVEPWPEAVGAGDLLTDLVATIGRHVILSAEEAVCIALWIMHTWVYERFQHTPRLSITSPTKRCGKSTLLALLRRLCRRSVKADSISASSVFRTVQLLDTITLLVDEADTFLRENEELRGVLNSGFEAGSGVIRVAEVQGEHVPVFFPTSCAVAVAAIKGLPDTIEDRAVPVVLKRKTQGETIVRLRDPGAREALGILARKLARWGVDHVAGLPLLPEIPVAFGDREGDICVPLLAISDQAGGDWPDRARTALSGVFGLRAASEVGVDLGILLLGDIRDLFAASGDVVFASADLVSKLERMEDRPWPDWRNGRPITATQVAKLLRLFGTRPGTHRRPGEGKVGKPVKGYRRDQFEEAWRRYLPPLADPVSDPEEGSSGAAGERDGGKEEDPNDVDSDTETFCEEDSFD